MSARQRPKQKNFLHKLLCCISPRTDDSLPSDRPATQQTAIANETLPATTQATADTPLEDTALTQSEKPPTDLVDSVQTNDSPGDSNAFTSPSAVLVEKIESSDDAIGLLESADMAPPLGHDSAVATVVVLQSGRRASTEPALPEERAALLDDEPLTPASAAMTATDPVADVVDQPSERLASDIELNEISWLLPPLDLSLQGKKCLVLDLDETLVHSSFKMIHQADFIVPVEIDSIVHNVYVIKRPGVDEFMKIMGEHFEIVVFTASLAKYADPVLDILDVHKVVHHRLFRESCHNHMGNYVKDLSQLGRDLRDAIIIDNSPASYVFHPAHAVPISSWFNDIHDTELTDLIPFLLDLTTVDDVSQVLELSI